MGILSSQTMKCDWVVMTDKWVMLCQRCGQSMQFPDRVPLNMVDKLMLLFVDEHRDCKPQNGPKTGQNPDIGTRP